MYHLNISVEVCGDTVQGGKVLGHQLINVTVKTLKDMENLIYLQDVMNVIAFDVVRDAWREAAERSES